MTNEHQQSILEDQMSEMSLKIGNDLIEAYKGYYEQEIDQDFPYHLAPRSRLEGGQYSEQFQKEWAIKKIRSHSPKERLEVYLEWNGILGYTSRIYELATGEL